MRVVLKAVPTCSSSSNQAGGAAAWSPSAACRRTGQDRGETAAAEQWTNGDAGVHNDSAEQSAGSTDKNRAVAAATRTRGAIDKKASRLCSLVHLGTRAGLLASEFALCRYGNGGVTAIRGSENPIR